MHISTYLLFIQYIKNIYFLFFGNTKPNTLRAEKKTKLERCKLRRKKTTRKRETTQIVRFHLP